MTRFSDLFVCTVPGCGRRFLSVRGLAVHKTRAHGTKKWSSKKVPAGDDGSPPLEPIDDGGAA